ncbi:pilus assembly PilX N-terminal domain-containing protein [Pseudidiomarina donghaiensis]|uniref:Type 4 fimbrial biogenesis protein PilX N-terminal domain-containing protein n=1 Tax=Pseudidiomarina donghaiensis TaxID=519452 RepID=A0A432XL08_9GAMM|nr:pilus assembly PilX N-terminal domain-containing protein [Pseudidiomarina donghaiensis]RUO49376.1 hypothetical protein CWE24_02415 [Pseudidiomarina donghaiensis]SFV21107.1 hypothetical protein SAMN04488139_0618 [Pseudidiomarina donghaiensis]
MRTKQTGFATITITVLLLAVIILVTLYTARFKMQEQRIMRNHAGMQEATMVSEAALEQVIIQLDNNKDNLDRTITGTIGGASYSATTVSTRFNNSLRGVVDVVDISLTANSADGRARRVLNQQVAVLPIIRSAPDTPVAIKGTMNVSGNFQVAANPNGGGDGVPLSIWTSGDVDINGSGSTCGQQEYTEGRCSSSPFSERGEHGVDILDNDPNFPPDLFEYLFGVPESQWETLRDAATMIIPNCSSLGPNSTGLIWVTGDCAPGTDIGSEENPVALIVQDTNVRINGNVTINGLVFSFRTPGSTASPELKLNGGANIQGAVMSNYDPDLSNGTLMVRYNEEVLTNIVTNDRFRRIFRIGGSWRDF